MLTVLAADFLPSTHGLPFPNWFPAGTPVVSLPTPFGRIPLGNANGGLCGGMIFTALDLFHHELPPPAAPTPAVVGYLGRRLLDSFDLPFGVLKYYDWQRRADVAALTSESEWPRVRQRIDGGRPATLGLVKAFSADPRQLGRNHQVLAYGYELDDADRLTLLAYDPNYPGDDGVTLTLDLRAAGGVTHSREGESVRGFFLTRYRVPPGPPALV